ncbi:hypothetical protein D3C76_682280 [compost metagenome]
MKQLAALLIRGRSELHRPMLVSLIQPYAALPALAAAKKSKATQNEPTSNAPPLTEPTTE